LQKVGDHVGIETFYVKHFTNKEMHDMKQISEANYLKKTNEQFISFKIEIKKTDCNKIQKILLEAEQEIKFYSNSSFE